MTGGGDVIKTGAALHHQTDHGQVARLGGSVEGTPICPRRLVHQPLSVGLASFALVFPFQQLSYPETKVKLGGLPQSENGKFPPKQNFGGGS